MKPPRITHVAVRFQGKIHSLPAPYRHCDVIRHIARTEDVDQVNAYGENQGFLDASGKYLTRAEAMHVARENGQLIKSTPLTTLFSEDLW